MLNTIKNAWRIPDLRKKMLYTLFIIVVFRFGSVIPVPFLDASALSTLMDAASDGNAALGYINMLTGGAFSYASLFAMGITPYINSSIIMQLLTIAIPALERLQKEGESGRKKIATITRYVTVGLGLIQGIAYYFYLRSNAGIVKVTSGFAGVLVGIVIVLTFTAGTALIMWMGEQINEKGIGNGISIILFAGIVARLPVTFGGVWQFFNLGLTSPSTSGQYLILAPLFIVLFLVVIWVIVFMNEAERRIPVQYAKKVVGRKMYGGQSTYMPVKVAMSGVMPVIFASAILGIPQFIQVFWNPTEGFGKAFIDAFSQTGWLYTVIYFLLIIMFAYFYMSVQYNPLEMANNLRQNNGTVPGLRPGRPTAEFIAKILSKVTLIGAMFLAFVALIPIIFTNLTNMQGLSLGGTSVIIIVGVALETVKQMESQMMMRHYKGFLD
ncbi:MULTISPECIES: preprotein translocase subunit SecY [unclassified Acutalibacter]|uniref:preprotein translocase subunit SecY n=1 Tax=unclassified Acutalibacter TaxID=2620728 RepID=UPI0014123302|nr:MULTISPECIES: preprotein translocase subunit SecY [unclassified Acutalibacter]MCI9225543.1 preprotein translocase subunit SecY [Acutalibacter sp.]NBJ88946.1 preprotein translocase subunit SecY [Acutalibacter sp. 1XD8-36]